jgi:16S rRNA (guanine527-N7)-methyltransferase
MTSARMDDAVRSKLEVMGVSRESQDRLQRFVDLLLTWQARINLISPASIPHIWDRHILDALQLLPLLPKAPALVADLGSGSGIPALPLAIVSGLTFHLHESNLKKAAFLMESLRVCVCSGKVHTKRLDGKGPLPHPPVDVVTARALAPLPQLLDWAEPFLKSGAKALFHKGQDAALELTQAQKYWRIQCTQHLSSTDSQARILEITEVSRVQ